MPDTPPSDEAVHPLEAIGALLREREESLAARRRAELEAERARLRSARWFKSYVASRIRPAMREVGDYLRGLGHDYDLTDRGLLNEQTEAFEETASVKFHLRLRGRGEHAFVHAGDASIEFRYPIGSDHGEVEEKVPGPDQAPQTPYRHSHGATREIDYGAVDRDDLVRAVADFVQRAIRCTLEG